jgi:hypothetical protein
MGAGVFLAPAAVGLTVLAARRGADTRSTSFLLGVALNVLLSMLVVGAVVLLIYESL